MIDSASTRKRVLTGWRVPCWRGVLLSSSLMLACGDDADTTADTGHVDTDGADADASIVSDASRAQETAITESDLETEGMAESVDTDEGAVGLEDAGIEPTGEADAGSCIAGCPRGETRCDEGRVELCEPDANGCDVWTGQSDCTPNGMICVQDEETATCQPPDPTCADGIQNQEEEGVDCGGPCALCPECTSDADCEDETCSAALLCVPSEDACVSAQENPFAAPHSLRWPLTSAEDDRARPSIGNSFGEFQRYGPDPSYIHSGVDIRGLEGDHVWSVSEGNIFRPANFAECDEGGGTACRLYVVSSEGRYIYYYSHLRFMNSDTMSGELRERISNAISTDYEIQPGTEIAQGERLSDIADFYANGWAHLHFSVIDIQSGYDGIDPLRALNAEAEEIFDDEPPRIDNLTLVADDTGPVADVSAGNAPALVLCELNSGEVRLQAAIKDSFVTDPSRVGTIPGSYDSIGVDSARTTIRRVGSGEVTVLPWYQFDQAPFLCVGPLKGSDCSTPMTVDDFYALSVDNEWGSPNMGTTYTPFLWDEDASNSEYWADELYVHQLTNSYGQAGTFSAGEPGLHEITVEARDAAGNKSAETLFSLLGNEGESLTPVGEVAIRDSEEDPGAVPSDVGGRAVAASPDILVVPQGVAVTVDSVPVDDVRLANALTWDVYVRVHNVGCGPVSGIRVRLSSLKRDLILSDPVRITPGEDFVADTRNPDGLTLGPAEQGLLGPFSWLPTDVELEAPFGRALLAEVSSDQEPPSSEPMVGSSLSLEVVKNDNNIAVRNVGGPAAVRLGNPTDAGACVQLEFWAPNGAAGQFSISSEASPWFERWAAVAGASLVEPAQLTFERRRVTTSAVPVPARTLLDADLTRPIGFGSGRLRVLVDERLVGEITVE